MKRRINIFKFVVVVSIFVSTNAAYAETADYLTNFKVPVQQTFCISKSANGDMNTYKKCMLAIEKGALKCDKESKEAYDKMLKKYSNFEGEATEFMDDVMPITAKHFDCLNTLY